jgi:2-polyprenyl-3-methyl-5-hydroxy-6-metoxy-1,4-benzoquinol methylase
MALGDARSGRHRACLICGSTRLHSLDRYAQAHLVRCANCSMVFAGRIPTDAELQEHYRDYGHAWQDSPITRQRYAELLDSFESLRASNRILDFGCGAGYFLEEARARGWQVYGTEYSGRALELARSKDLEVTQAPIGLDAFERGFFDVVTAFEVFEHVSDPHHEAHLIEHFLRPHGLLYCTTPNFDSLSRRLLGQRWSVIDYPEHLYYFTGRTLRSWLRRHGFEPETIQSTGLSVSRLRDVTRSGDSSASDPAYDERMRERIEGSQLLRLAKTAANAGLSVAGLGDSLKGRFRLRVVER